MTIYSQLQQKTPMQEAQVLETVPEEEAEDVEKLLPPKK